MLYSKQITVEANTAESSSSKTYVQINKGVIHTIFVTFPAGCVGLVKMRILYGGHAFLPVNKDAYIRGNNYTFPFLIMYEITEEPLTLTIEVWNDDDTYPHTVDIIISVLPKAYVLPVGATEGIMESLKSLVLHPIVIKEVGGPE